jgi:hypothetical protein
VATLIAWAAKRSVVARIKAWADQAVQGDALYGVEVHYALPPNPDRVCVYAGRVRSSRTQASGEHAVLFREDVALDVRVRVQEPGGDVESAERAAEGICAAVASAVSAEPRIVGSGGSVAVAATDQDPTIVAPDPDSTVTVNAVLTVSLSLMTPGG